MGNVIYTFIKRPVFTTMLVLLLVVFGLSSYSAIGIDLMPDVDMPLVTVTVTWAGTSPEEMETLVTKPIEDAVSSVSNIKTLSSVTTEGSSTTILEFNFGTDAKLSANDVREKVAGIRKRLPDQIDEPAVQRVDLTAQAILYLSLASDSRSPNETRKIAVDVVKDDLQRLDDVADVSVFGAAAREIQIQVDPRKLEAYNIGFAQVLSVINAQNIDTPGGRVNEQGTEITVRTLGQYRSVADIENIVVANQGIQTIRVRDIATVIDGWEEQRSYARTNGVPSVVIAVQKQSGTNTVAVAERVKNRMAELEKTVLPPDIKVTVVRDSTRYIRDNVNDVMMSLVFGGLLAVLVTFLFLQNIRATIIGALAIPTSIIATFFLMKEMNYTINNMSLMGLSLAVGILIDDAIVVIENIYRHMEKGETAMDASARGTTEISLAVMATTLSILAVFVPVGNMGEIIGQFFRQFAMTVAFAVAFSLFVAFSMTPMLAAHWLKIVPVDRARQRGPVRWVQKVLDAWEAGFAWLREFYKRVVGWALRRAGKIAALAFFVLIMLGYIFINFNFAQIIGTEFTPEYDSGEFNIALEAPAGTSMDKMQELVAPVEREVLSIPEMETAFVSIGMRGPVYKASIMVRLKPASERAQPWAQVIAQSHSAGDFFAGADRKLHVRVMRDIMDSLRIKFSHVKGLKVVVQNASSTGGRGDSRPVQIGLRGPDLAVLQGLAEKLADEIRKIPGASDVDISSAQAEPEVQIRFDPARMGQVGIDATTAGSAIQMAFLGMTTGNQYNVADKDYNIRVRMPEESRMSIDDVANLRISGSGGTFVRLGDIAEVKFSSGPTEIDREGRQRQIVVYANAVGISSGEILNIAEEKIIPAMNLPPGYGYRLVGQAQTQRDSATEIFKALLLAIVLIYMVLAAEFESFVHPFTIMLSLPFSLVGAILGLLIAGKTLNIISGIGIIMLMGLVTKNAILLIDYTNQLRANGMGITEALIEAGSVRLRPILMTTMTMIFGMLPIALGFGAGAELRSSMGAVLIGGLITSTFLTLIIVPVVYLLFDRLKNWWRRISLKNWLRRIRVTISASIGR